MANPPPLADTSPAPSLSGETCISSEDTTNNQHQGSTTPRQATECEIPTWEAKSEPQHASAFKKLLQQLELQHEHDIANLQQRVDALKLVQTGSTEPLPTTSPRSFCSAHSTSNSLLSSPPGLQGADVGRASIATEWTTTKPWRSFTLHSHWSRALCKRQLAANHLRHSSTTRVFVGVKEGMGSANSLDMFLAKYVLRPDGAFRSFWGIMSLALLAFDIWVIPMDCFLELPPSNFGSYLEWTGRFFWTADIPANFMTGTFVNACPELRPSRIALAYCRSWFVFDVALVLTDWLSAGAGALALLPLLRALRLLRLIRLLRIAKLQNLVQDLLMFTPDVVILIAGVLKIMCVVVIGTHVLGCAWFGIGRASYSGWARTDAMDEASVANRYFTSVLWIVSFLHGTGPMQPGNTVERGSAIVLTFCGFVVTAVFIGKMAHAVAALTDPRSEQVQQICRKYLRTRNVSAKLQFRLNKYLNMRSKRSFKEVVDHEAKLMETLPLDLRVDLAAETRTPVLLSAQLFLDLNWENRHLIRSICSEVVECIVVCTREVIFVSGDVCEHMLISESGLQMYTVDSTQKRSVSSHSLASSQGQNVENRRGWKRVLPDVLPFSSAWRKNVNGQLYEDAAVRNLCKRTSTRTSSSSIHSSSNSYRGCCFNEAALWTRWVYSGDLKAATDSTLLSINDAKFALTISKRVADMAQIARYARHFVTCLNVASKTNHALPDMLDFGITFQMVEELRETETTNDEHFVFLSHFKEEAGTEAALIQSALETKIHEDPEHPANDMVYPAFLDSCNLVDLTKLRETVSKSHNLVLLLTPNVLYRPWCLVEIATALKANIPVVPVEIQRPGLKFSFPDEAFYSALSTGKILSKSGELILQDEGVDMDELVSFVRQIFTKIAVPFSPHKSPSIRQDELDDIIARCTMQGDPMAPAKFAAIESSMVRLYSPKGKVAQSQPRACSPRNRVGCRNEDTFPPVLLPAQIDER